MLERLQENLYSMSDVIPLKNFLIYSEFSLILILLISLLFNEYFTNLITWLILVYLSILVLLSFVLLFTKLEFTFMAFIAGIFIISGSSIVAFFSELFLVTSSIHFLEVLFLINAVVIVFIGYKILKYQKTKVEKNSLLFMWWLFSILYIAYIPVLGLDLSRMSIGYGLLTSLLFGGFLSAASSLLYLKNYPVYEKKNQEINLNSKEHYEKVNKLK